MNDNCHTHSNAFSCKGTIPIWSPIGKGPKGDSTKVEAIENATGDSTILIGSELDATTGTWKEDWRTDNINGGKLTCQTIYYPEDPPTFQLKFTYSRPGKSQWTTTTPKIQYTGEQPEPGKTPVNTEDLGKVEGLSKQLIENIIAGLHDQIQSDIIEDLTADNFKEYIDKHAQHIVDAEANVDTLETNVDTLADQIAALETKVESLESGEFTVAQYNKSFPVGSAVIRPDDPTDLAPDDIKDKVQWQQLGTNNNEVFLRASTNAGETGGSDTVERDYGIEAVEANGAHAGFHAWGDAPHLNFQKLKLNNGTWSLARDASSGTATIQATRFASNVVHSSQETLGAGNGYDIRSWTTLSWDNKPKFINLPVWLRLPDLEQ